MSRERLVQRVVEGDGKAPAAQRRAAFEAKPVEPAAAAALLEKVRLSASRISDEDVAAAKAAGLSEDQIFELVVAAAVGQAKRQLDGALAALAEATK